ncbi:MAG: murein biosynthesis integral membrane protein MurJ [Desulfosarcinaceae bacterium]|nr:murein biosynthesis integral membrane protein MurJ [Desulfosarcinaceae bacterium]
MNRATGVVAAATLLSRVFGYVRDMVMAYFFGAGLAADAFIAAFRIPNLLRRLFGEGSLSIAFVPVFSETLARKGRQEAYALAGAAMGLLSVVVVAVAVLGVIASPLIIRMVAPGFVAEPAKMALTILLTRIMFPYICFVALVALCMGILNVLGHFAAPALAPVLLNLAMITSIFCAAWISPDLEVRVIGLSLGVLVGGLLQLLLQVPPMVAKGLRFWRVLRLYHPALKRVGRLMLPTVFGAAVYQINILVGTLLASLLPAGSVAYLYYADRLVQFPLGIFAIALSTAVLPSLSRQAAEEDLWGLTDTFRHALQLVLFITLPAMVGLILLREPIVALLFQRGDFDPNTTRLTAVALLYYGVGLWAFAAVRILVSTFYALQDTRTPVLTATIAIAANIVLGVLLMRPLAHGGLALATALASMLNLLLLIRALRRRLGSLGWRPIAHSAGRSLLAAAVMGGMIHLGGRFVLPAVPDNGLGLLVVLGGLMMLGIAVYMGLARLMGMPEVGAVWEIIGRRGRMRRHRQGTS